MLGGCARQELPHEPADGVLPPAPALSPYGNPDADPDMEPDVPDPEEGMPDLPVTFSI